MQHVKATVKWMAFRVGTADESCCGAGLGVWVCWVLGLWLGAGWAAVGLFVTSKFDVVAAG
jgi:hypothetical protein